MENEGLTLDVIKTLLDAREDLRAEENVKILTLAAQLRAMDP